MKRKQLVGLVVQVLLLVLHLSIVPSSLAQDYPYTPFSLMEYKTYYGPNSVENVFSVGDVNDDGYEDFIAINSGTTFFYFGGDVLDTLPSYHRTGQWRFAGDLNLNGTPELWNYHHPYGYYFLRLVDVSDFTEEPYFTWDIGSYFWCYNAKDPMGERDALFMYFHSRPYFVGLFLNLADGDTIPSWTFPRDSHLIEGYDTVINPYTFGDVNGNGYLDIVVSLENFWARQDEIPTVSYLFLDVLQPEIADTILLTPWHTDDEVWRSITRDGATIVKDINGDGIDELRVSYITLGYRIYTNFYLGSEDINPVVEPDFQYFSGTRFPTWVQNIGDVNMDGYDDLAFSTKDGNPSSFIMLGGPDFSAEPVAMISGWVRDRQFIGRRLLKGGDFTNSGVNTFFAQTQLDGDGTIGSFTYMMVLDSSYLSIDNNDVSLPESSELLDIYPNPFNNTVRVVFNLHFAEQVKLSVYTIDGRLVKSIIPYQSFQPGSYEMTWDGTDHNDNPVSSGIYLFQINTETVQRTVKGTLVR